MKIDPNISVFVQLADHLRKEIYAGKRPPGSRMESIREMALLLEVNPNTIKRVYQELEEEGLIETPGTAGSFVTSNHDLIHRSRESFLQNKADEIAKIFDLLDVHEEEWIRILKGRNVK